MGTLVKDAFVVPESIDRVARSSCGPRTTTPTPRFADLPVADAKARIIDAIETGAITFPPFETDTWPECRPLVEWMIGLLPDGGRGYERPEWPERRRDEPLAERFFASHFGAPLDDRDHRGLLDSIMWFGCDYGPGDPCAGARSPSRSSSTTGSPARSSPTPTTCPRRRRCCAASSASATPSAGIPAHLTDQTLDAVDAVGTRLPGDHPLATAAGAGRAAGGHGRPRPRWPLDDDERATRTTRSLADYEALMLGFLERAVGGPAALDALDDSRCPTRLRLDRHPRGHPRPRRRGARALRQVLRQLLDVEYRTACRRVLARIAANGPGVFRRPGRSDTAAAAICWTVCRVNDTFDQRPRRTHPEGIARELGIKGSGNIATRAATLLDAGGFPRHSNDFTLGSPTYLVSTRRRDTSPRQARAILGARTAGGSPASHWRVQAEDLGLEF